MCTSYRPRRKCAQEKRKDEDDETRRQKDMKEKKEMKGDKPMTDPTSLKNLLQKPCLFVGTPRTKKEGGEKEEEKRG